VVKKPKRGKVGGQTFVIYKSMKKKGISSGVFLSFLSVVKDGFGRVGPRRKMGVLRGFLGEKQDGTDWSAVR